MQVAIANYLSPLYLLLYNILLLLFYGKIILFFTNKLRILGRVTIAWIHSKLVCPSHIIIFTDIKQYSYQRVFLCCCRWWAVRCSRWCISLTRIKWTVLVLPKNRFIPQWVDKCLNSILQYSTETRQRKRKETNAPFNNMQQNTYRIKSTRCFRKLSRSFIDFWNRWETRFVLAVCSLLPSFIASKKKQCWVK